MNTDEKYEAVIKAMDEYTYQWNPENALDPTKPILKITKSSLGAFKWCANKYKFSYIERLPQDQTEAMRKGTIVHNAREDFFNDFDISKAENMSSGEILEYCNSLFPVDDYMDMYMTIASFEAQRFIDARDEGKLDEFIPIINEECFDCEIVIPHDIHPDFSLARDYKVHLQGIIDRVFNEGNNLIPMELKTGLWKDNPNKYTSMRKEMAFYEILINNSTQEVREKFGLTEDMKVTHWGWYYPASNFIHVEPLKKVTIKSVMKNIAELIKAYEDNLFLPKYWAKTCAHCSYFGICEAATEDTWG